MSTEENKALMRHFYEEVFNQKNVAAIDDFIAPTFVNHSASQLGLTAGDLEHVTQFVSMVMQVFPDLHYTVEDLVAEGDKVVARLTISGTQQGPLWASPQPANTRRFRTSRSFALRAARRSRPGCKLTSSACCNN